MHRQRDTHVRAVKGGRVAEARKVLIICKGCGMHNASHNPSCVCLLPIEQKISLAARTPIKRDQLPKCMTRSANDDNAIGPFKASVRIKSKRFNGIQK